MTGPEKRGRGLEVLFAAAYSRCELLKQGALGSSHIPTCQGCRRSSSQSPRSPRQPRDFGRNAGNHVSSSLPPQTSLTRQRFTVDRKKHHLTLHTLPKEYRSLQKIQFHQYSHPKEILDMNILEFHIREEIHPLPRQLRPVAAIYSHITTTKSTTTNCLWCCPTRPENKSQNADVDARFSDKILKVAS